MFVAIREATEEHSKAMFARQTMADTSVDRDGGGLRVQGGAGISGRTPVSSGSAASALQPCNTKPARSSVTACRGEQGPVMPP